jgi:hypothetical protein
MMPIGSKEAKKFQDTDKMKKPDHKMASIKKR